MKKLSILGAIAAVGMSLSAAAPTAEAQTLRVMRYIDAPHFDAHRTTWAPTGWGVNQMQSTLVALDWDGRTPIPYLAKSWEVSADGKTYTFKLREDVQFCSGKKFTAADVVYSFTRLNSPEIKGPFAWRSGKIKELRAVDNYTVAYELTEPYSDLLLQLTMFTNVIVNKDNVEALGKDYGVTGMDGTGPWCFESWKPRTELILRRHDAYRWGPSMFKNPGPVKFERMHVRIVPEESSRMAAMMSGQFDFTENFPSAFIPQAKVSPNLNVVTVKPNFQLLYFGYKTSRPMVADARVREAMNIAINRADIAKGVLLGNADPAYTFVDPDALDYSAKTANIIREDVERAKKLLDEAGWVPGPDGIRVKDGMRLSPLVYFTSNGLSVKPAEAIQGYLRRIGVEWRLQAWDSTIAFAKMGEQDYEIWSVTVPYLTAGDLMSLYFDSKNIPSPNRMNWKDARTDELLALAKGALTPAVRTENFQAVQERVMSEHLWMPVMNMQMHMVTSKKLKGARAHMLYGNALYKGLDFEP